MDKEALEERIEALRENHEVAKANAIAISGAIQDCEYWLDVLAQGERVEEPCCEQPAVMATGFTQE